MLYTLLQVGLPPAREAELATIHKYVTALHPRPIPFRQKILNLLSPHGFFQAQNAPKPVFGRGSAPDPAGGAYDAPPDPLVGWGGGHPLSINKEQQRTNCGYSLIC